MTNSLANASANSPFRRFGLGASIVILVFLAPLAQAEEVNLITGKGQLSLGSFINNSTTKIRLDGDLGTEGTTIDWGQQFGDADVTRFRLDGVWRFSDKHHLRILYTDYSREKTAVLDEDINWGDDTLLTGATARGLLEFSIYEAAYEYALRHSDRTELALTAGLHYTTFAATLTADADTGGGGGASGRVGSKASVGAPLPVFGGRGLWRLGRSFYIDAQFQWFALSIDAYDGSITNYRADVIWQPRKWVGIGLGYDYFNVNVDVDKSRFNGSLDWTYQGPQIFFNFSL